MYDNQHRKYAEMRQILLILTVLNVPGWSQPAQQPAQPPVPLENVWMALLKVALPTILGAGLGAGITLYGLRQNNKHTAAENAANREHQFRLETAKDKIAAEAKSRDSRWSFRRDVYVNLINATTNMIHGQLGLMTCAQLYSRSNDTSDLNQAKESVKRQTKAVEEFLTSLELAPLAVADSLRTAFQSRKPRLPNVDLRQPDAERTLQETVADFRRFLLLIQEGGRKHLWGMAKTEPET